jgi:hypothetical protein
MTTIRINQSVPRFIQDYQRRIDGIQKSVVIQLEAFHNSWSWKITGPLRKIYAIIFSKRLKNE